MKIISTKIVDARLTNIKHTKNNYNVTATEKKMVKYLIAQKYFDKWTFNTRSKYKKYKVQSLGNNKYKVNIKEDPPKDPNKWTVPPIEFIATLV